MKKKILMLGFIMCLVVTAFTLGNNVNADFSFDNLKVVEQYTYEEVKEKFKEDGNQGIVKQYIQFVEDPSYAPTNDDVINNSNLGNTKTFVNKDFDYQPSIFASLRNVASSTLDSEREFLWLGYTDGGVDIVDLKDNSVKSFEKDEFTDGNLLLLVGSDIREDTYVITENGVTVISQK